MELNEIINDAAHYPISDYKKFLTLGLPYLIIAIFALLLAFQALDFEKIMDLPREAMISSPTFSSFLITFALYFIISIIGFVIISGISVSVIRETINNNDQLPNLEIVKNFVDGLKCFVISLVYLGIPTVILFILMIIAIAAFGDYVGLIVILLMILYFILMVFIMLLYPVIYSKLAETDSIGETLKFKEIYQITKNIGFGKVFAVIVISAFISFIINIVGTFLQYIPILGYLITMFILYNFLMLFSARSFGLLYRDRFGTTNQYQPTPTNNVQAINEEQNNVNEKPSIDEEHPLDYQPEQIPEKSADESDSNMKSCSNCGYGNPSYANNCANCGNKL